MLRRVMDVERWSSILHLNPWRSVVGDRENFSKWSANLRKSGGMHSLQSTWTAFSNRDETLLSESVGQKTLRLPRVLPLSCLRRPRLGMCLMLSKPSDLRAQHRRLFADGNTLGVPQ